MSKLIKTIFSRTTFMILAAIAEVLLLFVIFRYFSEKAGWIEGVFRFLSLIIVLAIIRNSRHLSSDLMWIILIILFPVPGSAVYLFLGANLLRSKTFKNLLVSGEACKKYYVQDGEVIDELNQKYPETKGSFHYLTKQSGFAFYRNTGFDYYSLGDTGYPVMLEELKKAEKFIFIEYFIIEEGVMWNGILEILEQKVKEGLDVRVLYDDLGSFNTLSLNYAQTLEEKGIKCVPFNRINPILGSIMSHRDHRKIMGIDGKTAFSGGVNLADEYINAIVKHGKWKDNIIRIKGDAVWSYTVMFLSTWNALCETDKDYTVFKAEHVEGEYDGYIAPYGETPLDSELTAQSVYMNILNQANDYCYIMTPYLIIDTELMNALILAKHRGVDVRLLTPGIPDKKMVYDITKSYYENLIRGGVRIFEYKPGFVHSKVFVSDDDKAVVGTINLDYRSLYLHFENGTYIQGCSKIQDIKQDFLNACAEGKEVIQREEFSQGMIKRFYTSVLRIFAGLM